MHLTLKYILVINRSGAVILVNFKYMKSNSRWKSTYTTHSNALVSQWHINYKSKAHHHYYAKMLQIT